MIVRNDTGPLALLAIVGLVIACLLGSSLTQTELFNPTLMKQQADSNAQKDELKAKEAQAENQVTQQARQSTANYEGMVVKLTQIPIERTLVAAEYQVTLDALSPTQTAQVEEAKQKQSQAELTSWQKDQDARREQEANQAQINTIGQYGAMFIIVILTGLMVYLIKQVNADIKIRSMEAEVKKLAEQRRLEEMRAALYMNKLSPGTEKLNSHSRTPTIPLRELNKK